MRETLYENHNIMINSCSLHWTSNIILVCYERENLFREVPLETKMPSYFVGFKREFVITEIVCRATRKHFKHQRLDDVKVRC